MLRRAVSQCVYMQSLVFTQKVRRPAVLPHFANAQDQSRRQNAKAYLGDLHGLLAAIILVTFAPYQTKGGNICNLLTACTIQVMLNHTMHTMQAGGYGSCSAASESPSQQQVLHLFAVGYEYVLATVNLQ